VLGCSPGVGKRFQMQAEPFDAGELLAEMCWRSGLLSRSGLRLCDMAVGYERRDIVREAFQRIDRGHLFGSAIQLTS